MLALHDGKSSGEESFATFRALRKLTALLTGFTLLNSVEEFDAALRSGELALSTNLGRASMGWALSLEAL